MIANKRFQAHLDFAHQIWQQLVQPGDTVIDATCGNGHDTLMLAQLALTPTQGRLLAFDIQEVAIANTDKLLQANLSSSQFSRVQLIAGSHAVFSSDISQQSVRLIVYNLGYLPKGDKSLTTQVESTLKSLQLAQDLIMPGGLICITCYPGHAEGELEETALLQYTAKLNLAEWSCSHHRWINKSKAPSVLLIQKNY